MPSFYFSQDDAIEDEEKKKPKPGQVDYNVTKAVKKAKKKKKKMLEEAGR